MISVRNFFRKCLSEEFLHFCGFLGLLHLLLPPWGPIVIGGGTVLLRVFPDQRRKWFGALNFAVIFLIASGYPFHPFSADVWRFPDALVHFGCAAASVLFFLLYVRGTLRWPRPAALLVLLGFVLVLVTALPGLDGIPRTFIRLIAQSTLYVSFFMMAISPARPPGVLDILNHQVPWFSMFPWAPITAIPVLADDLQGPPDRKVASKSRRDALMLLVLVLVCHHAPLFLARWSRDWPDLKVLLRGEISAGAGFWAGRDRWHTAFDYWMILGVSYLGFLTKVIETIGPSVAALKMLGVRVDFPVADFWNSTDPGEWFRRSNMHYSRVVQQVFVALFLRTRVLFTMPRLKIHLSLIFGIALAGVWSHYVFLCLHRPVGAGSFSDSWGRLTVIMIYWPLLAAVICGYHLLRPQKRLGLAPGVSLWFGRITSFFIWVGLLTFTIDALSGPPVPLHVRWLQFLRLFGI